MQRSQLRQFLPGAIALAVLACLLHGDLSDTDFVGLSRKSLSQKLLPAHERPQRPRLADTGNAGSDLYKLG